MKKICTIVLVMLMACFFSNAFSQEDPFRIGLKFGYPQLIGLNLEYVTPALGERLSADADISYFSLTVDESKASYVFWGLGANYYFFDEGRGLYAGIGYARQSFGADLKVQDPNSSMFATANATLAFNNLYLKVGGKHGGLFYFRWNVGYRVALNDGQLEASATFNGTTETTVEDAPIGGGGFMGDIGFGFSF